MNHEQNPPGPTYWRQWLAAFLLIGGVTASVAVSKWRKPVPAPPPLPEQAAYVDWFMMVRCPEMPIEAGGATNRLHEWFTALRREGFHPRPFAEVMERLRDGGKVPAKTVVLVFDPSYRKTVEQVLPLMEAEGIPALWITHSPGVLRADRRFVSSHERKKLAATPLWDFALETSEAGFLLEEESAAGGIPRAYHWDDKVGLSGVNSGGTLSRLRRLHANAHWSAEEFIDRLKADLILRDPAMLSTRLIDGRAWGIIASSAQPESFDLAAAPTNRFASLTWWGTKGVRDLALKVQIESWFGEAWMFLRSNEDRTEGIRIGLMEGRVRVLQERNGEVFADASEAWPIDPADGLKLEVRLEGDQLQLSSPLAPVPFSLRVAIAGSEESKLELALYHRIRGAARAEKILIAAAPMSPGTESGLPSSVGRPPESEQSSGSEEVLSLPASPEL